MAADPEFKGVDQRHRRADREHVPDALHAARGRGEVQAAVVRPPDDLQAARHRPRPARRADEARPATEPGIRKVLVASGIRMDLAQLVAGVRAASWPRTTSAASSRSRRSTPTRTCSTLMKKPANDNFEGFADEFNEGVAAGGQAEAVPRALLHRQPSRQRPARDDRPGPVPEAQRLPPRPGAGLHPGPVRHRHVHVLHRASTRSRRSRSTSPGTCATASCSGP